MRTTLAFASLSLLFACSSDDEPANLPTPSQQLPASTATLDSTLIPTVNELPGLDNSDPARPVAVVEDALGNRVELIANELLVLTEEQAELDALVARWSGTVSWSVELPEDDGGVVRTLHLVRIETSGADAARLPTLMRSADSTTRSDLRASSQKSLELLAAAGAEGVDHGLRVSPNFLMAADAVTDRSTTEAPSSADTGYDASAFNWEQMRRGGGLDIGAAEAWRMLEDAGRDTNRVKVAITDGGFVGNADFPAGTTTILPPGSEGTRNPASCTGGSSCPWHGTGVAQIAGGLIDNGFGAAGTGGQVADMTLVSSAAADFASYVRWIFDGLLPTLADNPRLLNISAGTSVPAGLWALTFGTVDGLAGIMRSAGLLIVAAAGNDGVDVDEEDCFLGICWEGAKWIPCELDGVLCVGGVNYADRSAHPSSNWGSKKDSGSVEIYAPFFNWVGPDPDDPGSGNVARLIAGTSGATPFVTGVLAMVLAADPTASVNDAASILASTAHTAPSARAHHVVNAFEAVRTALGDAPPYLEILAPTSGASFTGGSSSVPLNAYVENEEGDLPTVTWSSNRDGTIASGTFTAVTTLSIGAHVLTATATDAAWSVHRSVTVTITDAPPTVEITVPTSDPATVYTGQTLYLEATSFDPTTLAALSDAQMSWRVGSPTAAAFATGHATSTVFATTGTRTLYVVGTDGSSSVSDSVTIDVTAPPINLPPDVTITEPAANVDEYSYDNDATGWYLTVDLAGTADDPETTLLTGTSLRWLMRKETTTGWTSWTEIGTGTSLTGTPFHGDPGQPLTTYQVKLEATDPDSQVGESPPRTIYVRVLI